MLLSLEEQVADRDALLFERRHDHLALVRRDDGVLVALKHDHRRGNFSTWLTGDRSS